MSEYRQGQRVRVEAFEGTIKRLEAHNLCIEIEDDNHYHHYIFADGYVGAKIALLDPENWPPQIGDLWEADGKEWFARRNSYTGGITLVPDIANGLVFSLTDTGGEIFGNEADPGNFKALNPRLVRRRGQ